MNENGQAGGCGVTSSGSAVCFGDQPPADATDAKLTALGAVTAVAGYETLFRCAIINGTGRCFGSWNQGAPGMPLDLGPVVAIAVQDPDYVCWISGAVSGANGESAGLGACLVRVRALRPGPGAPHLLDPRPLALYLSNCCPPLRTPPLKTPAYCSSGNGGCASDSCCSYSYGDATALGAPVCTPLTSFGTVPASPPATTCAASE